MAAACTSWCQLRRSKAQATEAEAGRHMALREVAAAFHTRRHLMKVLEFHCLVSAYLRKALVFHHMELVAPGGSRLGLTHLSLVL